MMEFSAKYLADYLKGTVEGDPEIKVFEVSRIEEGKPGSLTFLANPQYEKYIYTTSASVVLVNSTFKPENHIKSTLIRVENAYQAFAALLDLYEKFMKNEKKGIEKEAFIHESAVLGSDVYVGGQTYIGKNVVVGNNVKVYPQVFLGDNVQIGDNTVLYPGVKIYRSCKVGADCILHSGVIIGADGFGFAHCSNNNYQKVPQTGNVVVEENVEIGSNTTIDRATIGSTIIRKGVKLDNLIQVAHNVEIGENTVIAAQTGISGSTKIGKNCMIGGQVGIVGHITIADGVKIAAQSGVGSSILRKGEIVQGSPAYPVLSYQKSYVLFKKLPELNREIDEMKKEIESLKSLINKH